MALSTRTNKALALRRTNPFQQFGQAGDMYTFGGAAGCTHTVLQYLALLWKGRWYSHDQISIMVGYPKPAYNGRMRGLYPSEVRTFIYKAGLPYKVVNSMSAYDVLQKTSLGPVAFGHAYSWVPEWYSFVYNGIRADGRPNGYAQPFDKAGKTQLSGFTGAHMGVVLGWDSAQSPSQPRVYIWEPNHNSPSRPENPPYDKVTSAQFRNVYESYRRVLGRSLYAIVPTRGL
jgi:hypothetical protein